MRPEELTFEMADTDPDPWALLKAVGAQPVALKTAGYWKLSWWEGPRVRQGNFNTLEFGCREALKGIVAIYSPQKSRRGRGVGL